MEPLRDDQLIAELRALRPTPSSAFATELDERAAAGFPRRSRFRSSLPSLPAKRLLIPATGLAVIAIAVLTALTVGESESGSTGEPLSKAGTEALPGQTAPDARTASPDEASVPSFDAEAPAAGAAGSATAGAQIKPFSPALRHRDVERSAEITLGARPDDVADDAAKVFDAVHAHHGIVMRSSTSQGKPGEAGARFELLIPSRELGGALAAFSQIDAVRSRHEATADITAPTVGAAELLRESRARIDSLLGQLEEAETESEREAVEVELRHERRRSSRLADQLNRLHRRADYSRVLLRIETGPGAEQGGGGSWGIDDALHDAGRILAVAAAVVLVSLAVIGPIALIALLAWLCHRAWVRRERRRALG